MAAFVAQLWSTCHIIQVMGSNLADVFTKSLQIILVSPQAAQAKHPFFVKENVMLHLLEGPD